MKKLTTLLMLLGIGVFIIGCSDAETDKPDGNGTNSSETDSTDADTENADTDDADTDDADTDDADTDADANTDSDDSEE